MKVSQNVRNHIRGMVEKKFENLPKEPIVEEYERCCDAVNEYEDSLQKYVNERLKELSEKYPRMKVGSSLYLQMQSSQLQREYQEARQRRYDKIEKIVDEIVFRLELGCKASELENLIDELVEKA